LISIVITSPAYDSAATADLQIKLLKTFDAAELPSAAETTKKFVVWQINNAQIRYTDTLLALPAVRPSSLNVV